MTDSEIISAFHAMWDDFPEPVTMTQRSREMIAVNKAAEKAGLKPGIKCSSIGRPEDHRGCLCNRAIDSGQPIGVHYEDGPFGQAYGYWIPLSVRPEWVLHFSVGRSAAYAKLER